MLRVSDFTSKDLLLLKYFSLVLLLVLLTLALLSFNTTRQSDIVIDGPFVHERMIPTRQDIDLSEPPSGVVPPQWQPGNPTIDPGDIRSTKAIPVARHGRLKRWLRRLCCSIFSCRPAPPQLPPKKTNPTKVTGGISVDGIPATSYTVPDPVGDIGLDYYIQAVNSAFQIFDKSGLPLSEVTYIHDLWNGVNSPCNTLDPVDPIVRYDNAADRWLISGFVWKGLPVDHLCIAISQSSNPVSGGWFLYEFASVDSVTDEVFSLDSPKLSVWPDAYYMSTARSYDQDLGLDAWALERSRMLAGLPAGLVQFHMSAPTIIVLPGDLDGPPPPAGSPAWFARQVDGERFDNGEDRVEVFGFSTDWVNPANSTFDLVASLPVDPFVSVICEPDDIWMVCVPQPEFNQELETLSAWPQWRLQYRNMAEHESLLFNHTINVGGDRHSGIRWYELRRSSAGNWSIFQQGTHFNEAMNYFMGSISMDRKGNIAIGYTASSKDVYPSIHIAHRMASDGPGMMPGLEFIAKSGLGSQTYDNPRWGNYSTMDVDPVDDCTFWYTNEYYPTSSEAGWLTHIASFRLPGCEPPSPIPDPGPLPPQDLSSD